MNDSQALEQFFNIMYERYVLPEIEARKVQGRVAQHFDINAIRACLVRLPKNASPIVELNDEFGWMVKNLKLAEGVILEPGKLVFSAGGLEG